MLNPSAIAVNLWFHLFGAASLPLPRFVAHVAFADVPAAKLASVGSVRHGGD
jgi:hypothetical protein